MASPTGSTQRVVALHVSIIIKWQTKSHESASTFRTRKKSQIPSDLLEIDSHEFAELVALFRDDDFKTVAQAGPLDMSKKLIRT